MPVTPERQGWFRFTVRLQEDEYRALERTCAQLGESPNTVIRAVIAKILPDLDLIGDVLPTAVGEERITAMEVLHTLATVYERRAEAFRAAARALEEQG
jgi:hypothetical protein